MITALFGQQADIFAPTPQADGFGDQRDTWSDTPTATVPCRLECQVIRARADYQGRRLVINRWRLYLPAGTPIATLNRVRVDGRMFEVWGIYPVQHPRRGTHHLLAELHTENDTIDTGG